MKIPANLFRILTGIVFMFSGFVKGVDPWGFAYKLQDYFIAYNWDFFIPFALVFSILLCTMEFSIGAWLVFNVITKKAAGLVLLMMVFFTGLTLYDAIYSPVSDCGCFGDAIKLTNWQTFYKNLVLLPMAVIVFAYRKQFKSWFACKTQWIIAALISLLFAGFCYYNYRHLPVIDFTEWRTGNKLYAENPQPVKTFLIYKNKSSGEQKEYLSPNFPYDDSTWMANWEFVSQRVEDPNVYYGKNLILTDSAGTDFTADVIRNPEFQLIFNVYDLAAISVDHAKFIQQFSQKAYDSDISSVIAVSATPEEMSNFVKKYSITVPVYNSDDVVLKTMVRSNGGLMLLKGGVVINKWNWRDISEFEKFKSKYLK